MSEEFDQENIDSIKNLLKEKYGEITETYIRNTRAYVGAIEQGIQNKDAKMIEDNAHPLKSASGMMGLVHLRELAEQAEDWAIAGVEDFSEDSDFFQLYLDLKAAMCRGFQKLEDEMLSMER